MLLPHSRKPMKEVKICTQFSIESCIEDWMINSVCLLRQLINFLEWRKKRRYPETSAIFHPKSLRWSCICISFSLSTFTKHWFCRFWNPFENSTNCPSSIRFHSLMAVSLFSSSKIRGISKNISLSYLMRASVLICFHSLMAIFLFFRLKVQGMSKNIS